MKDPDCFPLTADEARELFHLLYKATGGLAELHAPPQGIASQPVYRRGVMWVWHITQLLAVAANRFTVDDQDFNRPGVQLSAEQRAEKAIQADKRHERMAAAMLARLEEHERTYQAQQAAGREAPQ